MAHRHIIREIRQRTDPIDKADKRWWAPAVNLGEVTLPPVPDEGNVSMLDAINLALDLPDMPRGVARAITHRYGDPARGIPVIASAMDLPDHVVRVNPPKSWRVRYAASALRASAMKCS